MTFAPPLDWAPVDAALRRPRPDTTRWRSPRPDRRGRSRSALPSAGCGAARARPAVWAAGRGHRRRRWDESLGDDPPPRRARGGRAGRGGGAGEAHARGGRRGAGAVSLRRHPARRAARPAPGRRHRGGEVVCYRSVLAGEVEARRAAERAQVLVVASPSVADLLARACPPGVRPALLAVGPTTAAAARAVGLAARRRGRPARPRRRWPWPSGRWSPAR